MGFAGNKVVVTCLTGALNIHCSVVGGLFYSNVKYQRYYLITAKFHSLKADNNTYVEFEPRWADYFPFLNQPSAG